MPFFAALGGFEDLGKCVGRHRRRRRYAPGVWSTTKVVGQDGTWAVPWFTEARAIYYRKDLLEKAGVDRRRPSTTGTPSRRRSRSSRSARLTARRRAVRVTRQEGVRPRPQRDAVHLGGRRRRAERGRHEVDDRLDRGRGPGVEFVADLLPDGLFDKTPLEKDGTQVEESFKGGQLAVWVGGPWVLGTVPREDDEDVADAARANVGVAPMPSGPAGEAYTFVGGSNLMMFKTSKNKDAAWAVMKFLSEDQTQTAYADMPRHVPGAPRAAGEAAGEKDENYAKFLEAIKKGRSYAPIPQWAQVETAYKDSLRQHPRPGGRSRRRLHAEAVQEELDKAAEGSRRLAGPGSRLKTPVQGAGSAASPPSPSSGCPLHAAGRPTVPQGPARAPLGAARACPRGAAAPVGIAGRARARFAWALIAPAARSWCSST